MSDLKSVCVYCGSRPGDDQAFIETGRKLGKTLAAEGVELVFGGGDVGIMGATANAVVDAGGRVIGVIPKFLRDVEIPSERIQELILTDTMHERKHDMYERSDAFCVLPGGVGTLEEVIEVISWAQLQQHSKPIILVNVNNYWDPFLALLDHVMSRGFAGPETRKHYRVVESYDQVLPAIRSWINGGDREKTPRF